MIILGQRETERSNRLGKGQNVENHFVESQKKNIESPWMSNKNIKNQNIESLH